MAGSDKDRGTFGGVALALSFTAISISIVCLLQVFFLSGPNAQCSCPRNAREHPHSIPQDLRNATGKVKRARGPPKDIAAKKTRKETSKIVKQPLEEKHARKRRATQNKATQTNTNTAWGGYLHNAILRLQQQMIVVEGR